MSRLLIAVIVALPFAASAQPARIGNVYDGTAHQPAAGVQGQERAAGVGPSRETTQQENRDLGAMNEQLQRKAAEDAKTAPQVGNLYGVQPGGIVEATPATGMAGGSTR